jgi:hypothetical protein
VLHHSVLAWQAEIAFNIVGVNGWIGGPPSFYVLGVSSGVSSKDRDAPSFAYQ